MSSKKRKGPSGPTDLVRIDSILMDETKKMEWSRHALEQQGHRRLATVHAQERSEQVSNEETAQELLQENPWLDSQRFDGVDPDVSPAPPINSEARREFDNAQREQKLQKELRLGLTHAPTFSSKPKPPGTS